MGSRRKPNPLGPTVPLEEVIAGPGALEQGLIAAAGRYNPSKRGYFRGYYGADGSYHDID